MSKRLDTISSRISPDLHQQVAILANMDGMTVSGLVEHLLLQYKEDKRDTYLQLRQAFEGCQGLPGKQGSCE